MSQKWILIVDDEEAVLSVLKSSLKKLGPDFSVSTATNGMAALDLIRQHPYDLIVTDYKMAGMNGLELLDRIKAQQPNARVILMTAFGNASIQKDAQAKQAYRYLTKPLEITEFREIVKEAVKDAAASYSSVLVLSDEYYRQVSNLLNSLQSEVGARCVFLADGSGHFIAQAGDMGETPVDQIASLVGGAVVSLFEVGRLLDGSEDTMNLCYREGKRENLYVINIGLQLLLVIIIEVGQFSSRLGSVWYYAQQTATKLREKLSTAEYAQADTVLGQNFEGSLDAQLDQLFG